MFRQQKPREIYFLNGSVFDKEQAFLKIFLWFVSPSDL